MINKRDVEERFAQGANAFRMALDMHELLINLTDTVNNQAKAIEELKSEIRELKQDD